MLQRRPPKFMPQEVVPKQLQLKVSVCVCVCACLNLVFNFHSQRLTQLLMFQRKLLTWMSQQAGQKDFHLKVYIYVTVLIWDAYSVKTNDLSCSHDVFRPNY